jgi:chromatin remodeling complex protein RSC6
MATPITLETLDKKIEALRKDIRKIRQYIEDPSGEKAAARSANNGFNKPQKVSAELRTFLGLGPDELISRAQVGNHMNKYFETHGLKEGQKINMDDKLKALLDVPPDIQLTFLNIQRYMNKHYVKEPKPEGAEKKPRAKKTDEAAPAEPPKEKKSRPKVATKA